MSIGLSNESERFLFQHIRSIAQLELLLLMRTTAERWWSGDEVSHEMRIELSWANDELLNWSRRGLLEEAGDPPSRYRYQPRTPELELAVTELAQAFLLNRVRMIELIYSQPSPHVRAIADAFRLRKENPHG